MRRWTWRLLILVGVLVPAVPGLAVQYQVGPDQPYSAIGDVPWESLVPGDMVLIHWREENYREKWVIGTSGSVENPIVVRGVPGPAGQLPVIDGRNAVTRRALDFWNESRGLIKIGGSSTPGEAVPAHIVIENLELRSARPPYTFIDHSGSLQTYSLNGASFYVEVGQHLTIRNCLIHDSGNGIFIGAHNGDTRHILIEGNHIYDNGIENRPYEHNTYTEAIDIVYQYNFMGSLRTGATGNNLKDRSAGLVVRYNWIENGNRQLDLVEAQGNQELVDHPDYRRTFVYGNLLGEADGEGNSQIVHYGGDSGLENDYRKGVLYFYDNTVISTRGGNTTLLRLSTNEETAELYNNIVYTTAPGTSLAMLSENGILILHNNWLKSGWRLSHSTFAGQLTTSGILLEGSEPGFADLASGDYHLAPGAPVIDQGQPLPEAIPHRTDRQYLRERSWELRPGTGLPDMGAFGFARAGDLDGSDRVDPADVILGLRVLAGYPDQPAAISFFDIDDDGRLGFAEVLQALQIIADR